MMERFDTGESSDLVGTYRNLIGGDDCHPFHDSSSAVGAFEAGDWIDLLLHNLADIRWIRELDLRTDAGLS